MGAEREDPRTWFQGGSFKLFRMTGLGEGILTAGYGRALLQNKTPNEFSAKCLTPLRDLSINTVQQRRNRLHIAQH